MYGIRGMLFAKKAPNPPIPSIFIGKEPTSISIFGILSRKVGRYYMIFPT
jgi:hypothetical protein